MSESENSETIADIIAEMRIFKCRNLETGELEFCTAIANYFADRIEAAARRAYNQIDSAVCGIEDAASCEIDHVRKAMDETIGDYYE